RSAQHLAVPARPPPRKLRGACPGIAMRTLIKNGTVVTASDTTKTDVLIDGEKIAAIGSGLATGADQVIDAENRYVMPGAIDVHTHMELPFGGTFASDDFATGTAAAAWGGTTTIVDFAVQTFGQTLRQGLDQWHQKADGKAHIDYGFHMLVREINDAILKEMDTLVKEGVPSFKLFMAYPGVFMLDDASIFRAMSRTAENGGLIMMHAENGGAIDVLVKRYLAEGKGDPINHGLTRPASMEGEATSRAIALARLADFSKIPNGLPGVEDRFTLIYHGAVNSGRISVNRFVELVATAPARMFGLFPKKGTIAPGSDADVVVFNPNVERTLSARTHHMNVDYSCYEGMTVKGLPEVVIQRGNVLVRDGKFQGVKGAGQFLRRSAFHGVPAGEPSPVGVTA